MEKSALCPWCQFNPHNCKGVEKTCDFRNLPYEKNAMMSRTKQLYQEIDALKNQFESQHDKAKQLDLIRDIVDKSEGMKIIMGRLQAEFNVSAEQVREYAGIKPVSMKDSIKMRVALKAMQTFAQKKKDVELKPGTQKDLHKEYWK